MQRTLDIKYWDEVYGLVLGLIFFTIPLPLYTVGINSVLIIIFCLIWLIDSILNRHKPTLNWGIIFFISLFFLPLIHIDDALEIPAFFLNHIQKYNVLLVLPLAISTTKRLLNFEKLMNWFIGGVFFSLSIYYATAIFTDFNLNNKAIIPNSGNYFSLHISLISVYSLIKSLNSKNVVKYTFGLLYLFSFFIIINIPAKNQILSLGLISILIIISFNKNSWKKSIIILTFLLFLAIVSLFSFKNLQDEVNTLIKGKWTFVKDDMPENSISLRQQIWSCTIEISSENILRGVGSDYQKELNKCYKANDFWGWVPSYNSHNQYLHYQLQYGVIGLVLFLLVMFYLVKYAINLKDKTFIFFLLIFILAMFTENLLARNKGLILFTLISSIIFKNQINKTKD